MVQMGLSVYCWHMSPNPSILGLIPARGGSKGIPHKNIVDVAGKPLIAYTIEAALASKVMDRLVVTTDDKAIAEAAKTYGADVPFMRPAELSSDTATSMDTIVHAIEWLKEEQGYDSEYVLLLQPTSPLREARDIQEAVKILEKTKGDAVISVHAHAHPFWAKRLLEDGRLAELFTKEQQTSSDSGKKETYYAPNGALYLVKTPVLLARRTFYTEKTFAYVMPPERSLDIDTPWDLRIAQMELGSRK